MTSLPQVSEGKGSETLEAFTSSLYFIKLWKKCMAKIDFELGFLEINRIRRVNLYVN